MSLGELGRDLERLHLQMREHQRDHVTREGVANLAREVEELRSSIQWFIRAIVAQIIVVVAAVIVLLVGKAIG